MKEAENVHKAILNALQRAAEEGQPVAEVLDAVARGEELDTWFEPIGNGQYSLVISIRESKA